MEDRNEGFYWLPLNLSGLTSLPVLPSGAVVAGYERGRPTYVARVRWNDKYELGKLNAWAKFGYGYFGKEIEEDEGDVLVAKDGTSPAWINGAFGEHVPSVMMSQGPEGYQSVGRGWHQGRWVPGKVVHSCRHLYFSFGGKELAVRKYQLLSTGFAWKSCAEHSIPEGAVCPDESQPWVGSTSNLIRYSPGDYTAPADPVLIKTTDNRDCKWEVSGDGEYVKHAIAGLDGQSVARVWVERDGVSGWAATTVTAMWHMGKPGGVHYCGKLHRDYQVLTAGAPEVGLNMLSLHLQLDAEGQLVNSANPPSKDVLLAKSLAKGENPWVAVLQMVNLAEDKLREKAMQPVPQVDDAGMLSLMDHFPTNQPPAAAAVSYPTIQPPAAVESQLPAELPAPATALGSSSSSLPVPEHDEKMAKEAGTQTDEETPDIVRSPAAAASEGDLFEVLRSMHDFRSDRVSTPSDTTQVEAEAHEEEHKSDLQEPSSTAAKHDYGYTSDEYDFVDDVSIP